LVVHKKLKKPRKLKRYPLLTSSHRDHIKNKSLSPDMISKLAPKLEERFAELCTDLELILNSEQLSAVRILKLKKYFTEFYLLDELLRNVATESRPIYTAQFRSYLKGSGTNRIRVYWLNVASQSTYRATTDVFKPKHLFRHRSMADVSNTDKSILRKLYETGRTDIIPHERNKAISMSKIKKKMK